MMRVAAGALCFVACAHPRVQPSAPPELRFERSRTGHIVVALEVDGRAGMPFIVDTGASATVMTPRAIAAAKLRRLESREEAMGAAGVATQAAVYTIGRLRAGTVEVADLRVLETSLEVLGDDRIAGVLGRDFLARYRVEIDLRSGVLRLRDPHSPAPPPSGTPIAFRDLPEGLIGLDVRLNGSAPVGAVLDLGAQVSIVNRRAAALAGVTAQAGGVQAMGVGGAAAALSPERFGRIQVGAATLADRTLYVGDLPVFGALGLGEGPAMIVGLDLLARGIIEIDYRRHQVVLPLDTSSPQPRPAVSTSSRR